MTEHRWNHDHWCVACGAGQADVANGRRPTECEGGLVAISHIVRGRRLAELVNPADALADLVVRVQGEPLTDHQRAKFAALRQWCEEPGS